MSDNYYVRLQQERQKNNSLTEAIERIVNEKIQSYIENSAVKIDVDSSEFKHKIIEQLFK